MVLSAVTSGRHTATVRYPAGMRPLPSAVQSTRATGSSGSAGVSTAGASVS